MLLRVAIIPHEIETVTLLLRVVNKLETVTQFPFINNQAASRYRVETRRKTTVFDAERWHDTSSHLAEKHKRTSLYRIVIVYTIHIPPTPGRVGARRPALRQLRQTTSTATPPATTSQPAPAAPWTTRTITYTHARLVTHTRTCSPVLIPYKHAKRNKTNYSREVPSKNIQSQRLQKQQPAQRHTQSY